MSDERLDELVDNFLDGQRSKQVSRDDLRRFVERIAREAVQEERDGYDPPED
jgi:uncharacterized protein (UPF0335 family)